MRAVQNPEMNLGQVAIEDIQFDARCRDDIPAVLKGIQYIYCNRELRERIFDLLEGAILAGANSSADGEGEGTKGVNPDRGRPGMELWSILVLGLLKQGINCDFDRLHDLTANHLNLRRMLGVSDWFEGALYSGRTLTRNVSLLTPELLASVNRLVVEAGHALAGSKPGVALQARADSFVVETHVHYPTDVSLLWDALRCLIRLTAGACRTYRIAGWRKRVYLTAQVRRLFNRVRSSRQRQQRPERVQAYLRQALALATRAEASLEALAAAGAEEWICNEIKAFIAHARRQADQLDRRVLQGERIPHEEKVLSLFQPHTRWCMKGKVGRPVELGVPVSVVESEHQFILHYKVHWTEADVEMAEPLVTETQALYPELAVCSFDKGYHSKANRERLDGLLELNATPAKGRLSQAAREREQSPEFVAARQAHPAVESAINNLERRGLDRVRADGSAGFERIVGLSVLAANLHRIGLLLQRRDRKLLKRQRLLRAA